MLRILMVTPRYFPYMGGVENHVYEIARRLVQHDVEITVLTTDPTGKLPNQEIVEGVRIQRVRAWPKEKDYYFAPQLWSIISATQWDVMHLQSYHTLVAPLAMLAAQYAHIPYVVTFHGGGHSSQLRNMMRSFQWALLRPLLVRAQKLVALTDEEKRTWQIRLNLGPERLVIIPNGADLPPLPENPNNLHPERIVIASVGRLERYKGHHRIIEVMPAILEQIPNVHLWIAGVGPYQTALEELAQSLHVADHVEIRAIPIAERAQMAEAVSQVALAVLLSDYETHPISMLEAIALGRPALVTDAPGLIDLAKQGLATAIPLDSTSSQVATAILDQLRHPKYPPPLALPTWDECATKLLALYHQVIEG